MKIIDQDGMLFGKINIFDLLVLIVILFVVLGILGVFKSNEFEKPAVPYGKYINLTLKVDKISYDNSFVGQKDTKKTLDREYEIVRVIEKQEQQGIYLIKLNMLVYDSTPYKFYQGYYQFDIKLDRSIFINYDDNAQIKGRIINFK